LVTTGQYHIDFRGGDLTESHVVHMIYPVLEVDLALDEAAEKLAMAFGVEYCLPARVHDAHSQVALDVEIILAPPCIFH
jgi:hypothetical protein